MVAIVIILSLTASLFNAVSAVIQRRVAGKPRARELFRRGFMTRLVRSKWWLIGAGVQIAGFLVQAAALSQGSMIVVAPLLTSDLVFLMLIMHFHFKVQTGWREWAAVAALCVGLALLLLLARPREGLLAFVDSPWPATLGTIVGLLLVAVFIVRRTNSSRWRALLAGTGAGLTFAVVSLFNKLSSGVLLTHGLSALFTSWPLYALLTAGLGSIIMQQNTYGAGPLAESQPAMEITEPVASVIIGMLLFGDTVSDSPSIIVGEILASLAIITGIILMTRSKKLYQAQL